MAENTTQLLKRARAALADAGLLLLSDARLPSLVTLVTGAPVKGSWWSHPQGNVIYSLANELHDLEDVEAVKLVDGKVTYVHRALWPALAGVGAAGESWQTDGLDAGAKALLRKLQKAGELRGDALPAAEAKALKALEPRLLFHTGQYHTDAGAHATRALTWELWAKERGLARKAWLDAARGRAALEEARAQLGGGKLPWEKAVRKARAAKA